MASIIKNLLGSGAADRELPAETRALIAELRAERERFAELIDRATTASDRLKADVDPLDAITVRLGELEDKLAEAEQVAGTIKGLDELATTLTTSQEQAEQRVGRVVADADRVTSAMDEIREKLDQGLALRDQLANFLELERPFAELRSEADAIRGQVQGTGEHVVRLREQHDRLLDGMKEAATKQDALDRRRDELGRTLFDKEGRITRIEQAVRTVDGVHTTVDELRRELNTLKTTADLVGQKASALEGQRETIDRALAQAENLERTMRTIDAGLRQQEQNEQRLSQLQEQLTAALSLHEDVVERSRTITDLQHEVDERTREVRAELASIGDETKKTVERFDFERRGVEAVTQRVADLRASLAECEKRLASVKDSIQVVGTLKTETEAVGAQVEAIISSAAQIGGEVARLDGLRRDLDTTAGTAREVVENVARIEQSRPAIDAALRDLEQVTRAHVAVKDALEQVELVRSELARTHAAHAETRQWLTGVEQTVAELRVQATELRGMAPTIEFVQKQTQRIGESMAGIEAQREAVEELRRRMEDYAAVGRQIDAHGTELEQRMAAAEERFAHLAERADEAERMTMTVASVASSLQQSDEQAGAIRASVSAIAARATSVEALAAQTKSLQDELAQRQVALEEATRMFETTSELRQEAAAAAEAIEERSRKLTKALANAEQRASAVNTSTQDLETRAGRRAESEERMAEFEARIAKWKQVDEDVARTLDNIVARQDTVETLRGTLEHMFDLSEKTTNHVREITAAHGEIEESRRLVTDILGRSEALRDTESSLDERKRQMAKAEERLARAEGLLADVEGNLDTLQGHKATVDQVMEQASSLQFLVKQAEAAIDTLREERKAAALAKFAGSSLRPGKVVGEIVGEIGGAAVEDDARAA